MGKWDSTSKRLLREKPQHYTSWLIDGALFIKALQTELKSRHIYADGLFEILIREKQALLHIEFQRYKDPLMLERLLEYIEQMITPLVEAGEFELLALGYAFTGLASNDPAYDEWLQRRFALLEDILEEPWTYQEIMKKGMRQERLQRVQEQREMLANLVRMRFPDLVTLTEVQTRDLNDPDVLHNLISRLFAVQTAEEAKQVLMELKPEEE